MGRLAYYKGSTVKDLLMGSENISGRHQGPCRPKTHIGILMPITVVSLDNSEIGFTVPKYGPASAVTKPYGNYLFGFEWSEYKSYLRKCPWVV